jgi:hypothetical protein
MTREKKINIYIERERERRERVGVSQGMVGFIGVWEELSEETRFMY